MDFFKKIFKKRNTLKTKEMEKWLQSLGLSSDENYWTISFTLSTTKIDNWFYSRNKLKNEDVKIELITPSSGTWVVQLERKDRLYVAQWRKENDFRIESQQIKFRKLVKWPELHAIYDFPELIHAIESALEIKFIKHVNVSAKFVDLEPHINSNSKLFKWLEVCAKIIGTNMKPVQ